MPDDKKYGEIKIYETVEADTNLSAGEKAEGYSRE